MEDRQIRSGQERMTSRPHGEHSASPETTETQSPTGFQTIEEVGPNKQMVGQSNPAARWLIPESFPT